MNMFRSDRRWEGRYQWNHLQIKPRCTNNQRADVPLSKQLCFVSTKHLGTCVALSSWVLLMTSIPKIILPVCQSVQAGDRTQVFSNPYIFHIYISIYISTQSHKTWYIFVPIQYLNCYNCSSKLSSLKASFLSLKPNIIIWPCSSSFHHQKEMATSRLSDGINPSSQTHLAIVWKRNN